MSAENTAKYNTQVRYPSRELTDKEVSDLLSMKKSEITNQKLIDLFAASLHVNKPRYNTYDTFTLKRGVFYNETDLKTTIGRYVFNMFCLPECYLKENHFYNDEVNKESLGKIENKMATMIIEDRMTTEEYTDFMNRTEWLGMCLCKYLVPSLSFDFNNPLKEVIEKRDRLMAEHKDEIAAGNITTIGNIEKELVSDAEKELKAKNDPSYELYKSKEFDFNEYKATSIMGGAFKDLATNKMILLKGNYIDGISRDEYIAYSQIGVMGAMGRGVSTQDYGYLTKQVNGAMQNVSVNPDPDHDCGTKLYTEVTILPEIATMYKYRYIIEGDKLIELDDANLQKYTGKTVKLRTPMYCKDKVFCVKCAGNMYHRMGIDKVGLMAMSLSGSLLNKSMKKFHDVTVKYNKIEYEKYLDELK